MPMIADTIVQTVGWTLLHSVWQGFFCWLIYGLSRRMTPAPGVRYLAGNVAVASFVVAQLVTAWVVWHSSMSGPIDGSPAPVAALGAPAATQKTPMMTLPDASWGAVADAIRPWLPALAYAWCSGVSLNGIRLFASVHLLSLEIRRGRQIVGELADRLHAAAAKIPLPRPAAFLETEALSVPATAGWLKPVILIPTSWAMNVPPDQLEAIVLHELAHVARRDFLGGVMRSCVSTLYFCHPLIRSITSSLAQDAEEACDALAAEAAGGRKRYAQALLALEEMRTSTPLLLGATGGDLRHRITRLAARQAIHRRQRFSLVAGTITASLFVMLLVGSVANARATEQRDMGWIRSRSFANAVLTITSADVDNASACEALARTVLEVRGTGTVSATGLTQLAEALRLGIAHDTLLREYAFAGPQYARATLPTFGSARERSVILEALVAKAKAGDDNPMLFARAAYALAAIEPIDRAGTRVFQLVQEPVMRHAARLTDRDSTLLMLAAAQHNSRGFHVLSRLSEPEPLSADEIDPMVDDLSDNPIVQVMLLDRRLNGPLCEQLLKRARERVGDRQIIGSLILIGAASPR